jgi:protein-L-isoaspartate(D-aspartate) O-methyltransferase
MVADLRGMGICEARVLDAMDAVPRHRFVPGPWQAYAYADRPLPIGMGQTISQPYIVARMLELLDPPATGRVLEVGAGSGYAACLLAHLVAEVVAVERHSLLAIAARRVLSDLNCDNVRVILSDGTRGYASSAPYDGILVSATAGEVPPALVEQLVEGGRLVLPVAAGDEEYLERHTRHGTDLAREVFSQVRFVPLVSGLN